MKRRIFALFIFALLLIVMSFAAEKPPVRVAFVFDDGPVIEQTVKMLELLKKEEVHVSFSYMGQNVDAHPELAAAAVKAGHEIQNHSYTHPHLKTLDDAAVFQEVSKASAAIERATGKPPAWFWAPFLELDDRVIAQVKKAGLTPFPFTHYHFISTDDWNVKETDAAAILKRATTDIQDKTVILCHEWRPETLAELPAIFAELRKQGCVFLTFSELAQLKP
jgi:peptidoglycan/xylan/chitin deacetylase (PgdA/CDA1 family)